MSAECAALDSVDVVIRTAGQFERRTSLQRAIRSVLDQEGVRARPIVILNAHNPALAAELGSRHGVRLHIAAASNSLGELLAIGRRLVEAPFYSFLDDDDELVPNALAGSLRAMRSEPAPALVVTSGYWMSGDRKEVHIPDLTREQGDPLKGITTRCWLNPGGGLFRTAGVAEHYFEGLPQVCEWTFLAFRLAFDRREIRFLDHPTYLAHDTPGSLSKSRRYSEAAAQVIRRMQAYPLAPELRLALETKYRAAMHDLSARCLADGELGKAWRFHLRSLKPPHTLRYIAFTRKLIWGSTGTPRCDDVPGQSAAHPK
jgi:hypothetical protein